MKRLVIRLLDLLFPWGAASVRAHRAHTDYAQVRNGERWRGCRRDAEPYLAAARMILWAANSKEP